MLSQAVPGPPPPARDGRGGGEDSRKRKKQNAVQQVNIPVQSIYFLLQIVNAPTGNGEASSRPLDVSASQTFLKILDRALSLLYGTTAKTYKYSVIRTLPSQNSALFRLDDAAQFISLNAACTLFCDGTEVALRIVKSSPWLIGLCD